MVTTVLRSLIVDYYNKPCRILDPGLSCGPWKTREVTQSGGFLSTPLEMHVFGVGFCSEYFLSFGLLGSPAARILSDVDDSSKTGWLFHGNLGHTTYQYIFQYKSS